ncbi:hypothetical protein [Mesorhizobium sp.]|nr:hypothetical protein [Mesorhizobium sp.]
MVDMLEVLRFELMINVVCMEQPQASEEKRSMNIMPDWTSQ